MTITVTQLNNYIRGLFDVDGVLQNASVCGEITNVKRSHDGWYFSVKDESAQVDCFAYFGATEPVSGSVAVIDGTVNYYAKLGRVSLFARKITATDNVGSQYLRFVELRNKLSAEGLFADERKKDVPSCCKTVGVVTSETGAVIHDITNVALRRQPFTNILLYPVKVQGVGADEEIASGIRYFSQSAVDVVIVARGGGSNEDLSAFNSEIVVRAVAECSRPVVSAIGHGVDFTLCDFVADKRAVTPSEAAEFVTTDVNAYVKRVKTLLLQMHGALEQKLALSQARLSTTTGKLTVLAQNKVDFASNLLKTTLERQSNCLNARVENLNYKIGTSVERLSASNPLKVLERGFAYVTKDGKKVGTVGILAENDVIDVKLNDGTVSAKVTKVKK